ncbi:hypothetical protein Hdeb2414_s0006g00204341 [Helianthus debilis subsp. tardiflorus]
MGKQSGVESDYEQLGDVGLTKGKKLWKKVKYQLVEYHSLPAYMKDNEFILGHYRAEWPLKQIFLSIFTLHNETLNVWTHLIGFFLFLTLTIYSVKMIPDVNLPTLKNFPDVHKLREDLLTCIPSLPDLHKIRSEIKTSFPSNWHIVELLCNCLPERFSHSNHTDACVLHSMKEDLANIIAPLVTRPITRWPFFAFLGGAMFCLLASSLCHLLCCHSKRLSYIMLRLDYAGIAALISTSFYPPVYYSFMCHPFFCNLYLGFITVLGIATVMVSLLPVAVHTTGYEILMGLLYGMGSLIYATRIPERWMPGKFDIAGHSHNLFHVFVVAGAYTHYRAGLVYLKWRDLEGC